MTSVNSALALFSLTPLTLICHQLVLALGMLTLLAACAEPPPLPGTAAPLVTATLMACEETAPSPNLDSILPEFIPAYPCELENAANQVDFCLVQASPDLSYPCSQTESVQEIIIGKGIQTVLIQRDQHYSRGCWHGVSTDQRSLRVCQTEGGASTVLAADVVGDLVPSPDKAWFAFVATEPGSHRLKPHIFRVRADGSELMQLDKQSFPQDQVVGAQILQWSEDEYWLEIILWDGHEDGFHDYRLRTDGSGGFE